MMSSPEANRSAALIGIGQAGGPSELPIILAALNDKFKPKPIIKE